MSQKSEDIEKEKGRLTISTHQGHIVMDFDEILFLEADGSYTKVISHKTKTIASKPIKHFEKNLPDEFVRVHRSFLINKNHLKSLTRKDNNWWVQFTNSDKEIPISRKYKGKIEALI